MREILVGSNSLTQVDDQDYGDLMQFTWYLHSRNLNRVPYAYRQWKENGQRRSEFMHRRITKAPAGYMVDHADRDGLNNQRRNLRVCTGTFNNVNRELPDNVSGYRGVFPGGIGRWRAQVTFRGIRINLGTYRDRVEAARVWDAKAKELFGEFAWLNFPEEPVSDEIPF